MASSSLPGERLYPVKTTLEAVHANLTLDSAEQARLYLDFARRRLTEMQSLIAQGRYDGVPLAASEYEKDIQRALDAVTHLSRTDQSEALLLNVEIADTLSVYRGILLQLLIILPESQRDALQSAVDLSQSGANTQNDDDGIIGSIAQSATLTPEPTIIEATPTLAPAVTSDSVGSVSSEDVTGSGVTSSNNDAPAIQPTMTALIIIVPTSTSTPIPAAPADAVVQGGDATCTGSLGAVTVENLQVPQGASCTLNGTRVQGNIKVENGASLTAQGVSVIGNIQAEGANYVEVISSTVGGSIQLKQGGSARVEFVSVNGDIQFESNNGVFSAVGNQAGGNIQVFQNGGGVTISDNTVKVICSAKKIIQCLWEGITQSKAIRKFNVRDYDMSGMENLYE